MKVAAVFSVGNSPGGCEFALREIAARESDPPVVYFFHGQAEEGQESSPVSAVHAIRAAKEFEGRVRWGRDQGTRSFDLDKAYEAATRFLREVAAEGYDRVYVGITGGTNPMIAALFHAAMTELRGEVIPVYTQGMGTTSLGLSVAMKTRESLLLNRALRLAEGGEISSAARLTEELGGSGRAGFVRESLAALDRWDNFDYEAGETLAGLAPRARLLSGDGELGRLAATVERYGQTGRGMKDLAALFSSPEAFAQERGKASPEDWARRVQRHGLLFPADALANGWRRAAEGRWTDAVMRAYRAVEISLHQRLFAMGVHPSALEWEGGVLAALAGEWRNESGELPKMVSFEQSVRLVEGLTGVSFSAGRAKRQQLQRKRNYCYLEHGYERRDQAGARKALEGASESCDEIIGQPIKGAVEQLRMAFV